MTKKIKQCGMTLVELTVVLLILTALAGLVMPYVGNTSSTAMCQTTDATMQAVKEAIMGGNGGVGFYADNLGALPADSQTGRGYNLHFLFSQYDVDGTNKVWSDFNAKTVTGWRGPYLTTGGALSASPDASFGAVFNISASSNPAHVHIDIPNYDGADADSTGSLTESTKLLHVFDAWHRPIVLQVPYFNGNYQLHYARLVSAGPGIGLEPDAAALDTTIQSSDASDRGDDRVLFLRMPDPYPGGNIPCNQL